MEVKISKRIILLIATISSFITPFMGSSIVIALPQISKDFTLDAITSNWVANAYLLASAMFCVPFGKIADIHGRKKIFLFGMIGYTLSSFLCALSNSAALLIFFRVLQGIGSAAIFATSVAILTSAFDPKERGKVLGINAASIYLGLSTGPLLGGLLTEHFGWRSIFYINIPLGLTIITLVLWKMKRDWAYAKDEKFDFLGSVIYGISLVILMYGLYQLNTLEGLLLFMAGLAGIIGFGLWETRVTHPVLDLNIFKSNRVYTFSSLAALINYSATAAVSYLLSQYLQDLKDFSPIHAGLILAVQPLMQAIFSPFAGRLSDKIEPQKVASLGMGLTVAGLFLLVFLTETTPFAFIIISLVLLGLGFALFSSPNTNAIMSSIEKKFYGVASGTLGTMRLIGQMFSFGIAALIITIHMGKVQITPDNHPHFVSSMRTTFIILTVLCILGIFASLSRGNLRRVKQSQ